jgi:membrane-associated phospholipid phosphatase
LVPDYVGGIALLFTLVVSTVSLLSLVFGPNSATWSPLTWTIMTGIATVFGGVWMWKGPANLAGVTLLFPRAFVALNFVTFVTCIIGLITYIPLAATTAAYVSFAGPFLVVWILEITKDILLADPPQSGMDSGLAGYKEVNVWFHHGAKDLD